MLIDLIRHGEPVGGRRYRGWLDDPLSEKGWRQMWQAVGKEAPWKAIVSSPLRRCSEFASELALRHELPWETDVRLKELGFGAWEGRTADELTAEDPDALMRFYQDPVTHRPPGAEKLTDFRTRIASVWHELQGRPEEHLLVVVHAGVIRMILCQVLGMPEERMFSILVPNAGLTRIRVEGGGETRLAQLVFHAACGDSVT